MYVLNVSIRNITLSINQFICRYYLVKMLLQEDVYMLVQYLIKHNLGTIDLNQE